MPDTCGVCNYEDATRVVTVTTHNEFTRESDKSQYLLCRDCARDVQQQQWDSLEDRADFWTAKDLRDKCENATAVRWAPYIEGRPVGRGERGD
jgi:hypothetical protein